MKHLLKPISVILLLAFAQLSFAGYAYHYHTYYGPDYGPYYYSGCHHCHTYHTSMNNSDVGLLAGGIAGGLLGSTIGQGGGQFLAIAAGSIFGAMIGSSIGQSMDDYDRMRIHQALEQNSVGAPAYWRNEHSGIQYRIVPVRNVNINGNRYCREYRTTAIIDGKKQMMYGTACRQPDGAWRAIS